MKTSLTSALGGVVALLASLHTSPALADYTVACASNGYRYTTCRLSSPGRVTLERQTSSTRCKQGRNWDYDRHSIWVDDGCAGRFRVDSSSHDNKSMNTAAGIVVAAVLLGALSDHKQTEDPKYSDENYFGPRHSSYVPGWMVGKFRGVNIQHGNTEVLLTIKADGQVVALADGQSIRGYINDDYLHAGDAVFTVNRSSEGLFTTQVGDHRNVVQYRRIP